MHSDRRLCHAMSSRICLLSRKSASPDMCTHIRAVSGRVRTHMAEMEAEAEGCIVDRTTEAVAKAAAAAAVRHGARHRTRGIMVVGV